MQLIVNVYPFYGQNNNYEPGCFELSSQRTAESRYGHAKWNNIRKVSKHASSEFLKFTDWLKKSVWNKIFLLNLQELRTIATTGAEIISGTDKTVRYDTFISR